MKSTQIKYLADNTTFEICHKVTCFFAKIGNQARESQKILYLEVKYCLKYLITKGEKLSKLPFLNFKTQNV